MSDSVIAVRPELWMLNLNLDSSVIVLPLNSIDIGGGNGVRNLNETFGLVGLEHYALLVFVSPSMNEKDQTSACDDGQDPCYE